jgi:hypothetical protein
MGFRVSVDHNTEELVKRLTTDPAEVFGKPYGGYLLFLIGSTERELLNWISKNMVALDSLTSDIIAFAVFARDFNIKLKVPHYSDSNYESRPKKKIKKPLSEIKAFKSIDAFVKAGRCGWVIDGDEITAITYAVDEIARKLGILHELPCAIVLDAIPKGKFELFHLEKRKMSKLIPLLRKTVQNLIDDEDYKAFREKAYQVSKLVNQLKENFDRLKYLEDFIESFTFDSFLKRNSLTPENCKEHLKKGYLKNFKFLIQEFGDKFSIETNFVERIIQIAEKSHTVLRKYRDTINHLDVYSTSSTWPLEEPWRSRYVSAYYKYIRDVLDKPPQVPYLDSPDQCRQFIQELRIKQNSLVNQTANNILQSAGLGDLLKKTYEKEKRQLKAKIDLYREKRSNLENRYEEEVSIMIGICPSFIKYFKKEVRREKLQTISLDLKSKTLLYAYSWLSPETLSKFLSPLPT